MPSGLSPLQRKTLFRSVHKAAAELREDPEACRKRIMAEELGVEHLADVNPCGEYERLMARFSADAGDFDRALAFSLASVARYRFVILQTAKDILARSSHSRTRPLDYVAGIMLQSRMIQDASPRQGARTAHLQQ